MKIHPPAIFAVVEPIVSSAKARIQRALAISGTVIPCAREFREFGEMSNTVGLA